MHKETVMAAMTLSALVYNPQQPLAQDAEQAFYASPGGVQFLARRRGGKLTLVFRGSNSPLDWAHNLAFFKMEVPYGNPASKIRAHRGFLYAYKSEFVRGRIHQLAQGAHRIEVAGHSYGAALATLCAVDLQYNFPEKDIEAFLFGAPRVGNRAFMLSYNRRVPKTLRVECGNDVVTKVPPAVMGFRHVGARFHVGFPRLPLVFSAHDHYPVAYQQGLFDRLLP